MFLAVPVDPDRGDKREMLGCGAVDLERIARLTAR
jgi:hypothetical protein